MTKVELIDLSDVSKRKALFPRAPKACFGRKYNGAPGGPCMGGGRVKPCAYLDACCELVSARLAAGVTTPDDMRIPASFRPWAETGVPDATAYRQQEHQQVEVEPPMQPADANDDQEAAKPAKKANKKTAKKRSGGGRKKRAKPEPTEPAPTEEEAQEGGESGVADDTTGSADPASAPAPAIDGGRAATAVVAAMASPRQIDPPEETTITGEELARVDAAIREIEHKHLVSRIEYACALGEQVGYVYARMVPQEFSAWCQRYDLSRSTAMRYMQLADVMQAVGPAAKQAILNAPAMTLQKFDVLLRVAGPDHLLDVVQARALDRKGKEVPLSQLPVKELEAAARAHCDQATAQEAIDDAVARAQQLDAGQATAESVKKVEGEVVQDGPADLEPFNPVDLLLPVTAVLRDWKRERKKIGAGNVALLSPQDVRVLKRVVKELERTVIPDLKALLED